MSVRGFDHVQLAIPAGAEPAVRAFYGVLLGMTEIPKPAALAGRGGCWFEDGTAVLHFGVDDHFVPAGKAHPALVVDDLDDLRERLESAGHTCVRSDNEILGVRRFHTVDGVGNRIEFQQV